MARYKIKTLTYRTLLLEEEFSFGGQRETLVDPLWLLQEQLSHELPEEAVKATLCLIKEKNIDINKSIDEEGFGILHFAISRDCNAKMITLLLDAGADKDKQDIDLETPLYYAIQNRNLDIVQLLIDNGANINIRDRGMSTALHGAAFLQDTDIVRLLINSGAHINIGNINGDTALHGATFLQDTDIVRLLINSGADINIRNIKGHTALDLTTEYKKNAQSYTMEYEKDVESFAIDMARLLKKNKIIKRDEIIDAIKKTNFTLVALSIVANQEEITRLLIEHGAKRGYELPEEPSSMEI
jgi:ankyrin repeat protein